MAGFWFKLHKPSVAYAATLIGAKMMHSIFSFYYVKIYLHIFHVTQQWFQFAQVIFMIWNAINDPLFGYMQDTMNFSWVKSRRHTILYGAPFYGLSFALIWFPWGDYEQETVLSGIQLMFVLCFYDTLFTFVLLAHCSLFTEMSKKHEDRVRLVRYGQIGSMIGNSSLMFCNFYSTNAENFAKFQTFCVGVSILSFFFFWYTGKNALTEYDLASGTGNTSAESTKELIPEDKTQDYSVFRLCLQIFTQRNFVCFILVNFCQIYHTHYLGNFKVILCDYLISLEEFSQNARSFFFGAAYSVPQIILFIGTPCIQKFGYYTIIRASFILKILDGALLYMAGPHMWSLILYFLVDTAGAVAVFSMFGLVLSDIIDVDKNKYQRKHPVSSMVYGTNALVTKPAISFAPMIAVAILNMYGYEELTKARVAEPGATLAPLVATPELKATMFNLTCVTPIILGFLQLIIWSKYTIRNTHLTVPVHTEE